MEALFWLCVAGTGFSYFLYPALLLVFRARPICKASATTQPRISVVVAARNEGRRIAAKLEGTLSLDYPAELLEIIVASDASDDDTDAIVQSFASQGVRLSRTPARGGKEAAQALAIQKAAGDILVFTDSATRLDPDALRRIADAFTDPSVGAVSSEDRMEGPADGSAESSESAYVRYEMWLRRLESDRAGLVGLSGSLFAVRREIADGWPTTVPSDITAALLTARAGLRAIADPELFGHYPDLRNTHNEYERKLRTVVRGMAAVAAQRALLNPFRFGLFSLQLWGHKVMRWLTPVFMLLLLILSAVLASVSKVYLAFLLLQCAVYLLATVTWLIPALRRSSVCRLTLYLVQVHLALLHAVWRYLRGERIVMWTPSVR